MDRIAARLTLALSDPLEQSFSPQQIRLFIVNLSHFLAENPDDYEDFKSMVSFQKREITEERSKQESDYPESLGIFVE